MLLLQVELFFDPFNKILRAKNRCEIFLTVEFNDSQGVTFMNKLNIVFFRLPCFAGKHFKQKLLIQPIPLSGPGYISVVAGPGIFLNRFAYSDPNGISMNLAQ